MTTRRDFLKTGSLLGAVLVVPLDWATAEVQGFHPSPFVAIDGEGRVLLTVHKSEMGQGVRTALPMILAEELDVRLSDVTILQAIPGPGLDLGTGGSDSVESSWRPLRRAGAAARQMLLTAGADVLGVPRAQCFTKEGLVIDRMSDRRVPYGRLAAVASRLDVPADPPLKEPAQFGIVGQRVRRLDGPAIVTGAAVYSLDVRVAGMLRAAIKRPPRIGAKVARFDASRALAVKGVRQVVEVPSGVAVVAEDTWAAFQGREALDVSFEGGVDLDSGDFAKLLERASSTPGFETRREGDTEAALPRASERLEATYSYDFQTHAAMEPLSFFAHAEAGRCTLRGGTQAPEKVQKAVAALLQIPVEAVEVQVTLFGGGFGRRLAVDYALEAAAVSRASGKPVQVVWSREDDMAHGHFHPASCHRLVAGISESRLVAWLHRQAASFLTLYPPSGDDLKRVGYYQDSSWGQYDVPYSITNLRTEYVAVDSPVRSGPWRSVYSPPATFARECFLDEVATALRADPLALRLQLLEAPDILRVGSLAIDRRRFRRVLALAGEKAGWGRPLPSSPGRRFGRGIAGNVYDGNVHVAQVAEVSVGEKGDLRVHRVVCALDAGRVVNPSGLEAQVEGGILFALSAALKTRISWKGGVPEQSNYLDYPVLGWNEAPSIEVHIVEGEDRPRGVGEPPVPPSAPAVMNAVFAATGKRIRRLPLRAADLA